MDLSLRILHGLNLIHGLRIVFSQSPSGKRNGGGAEQGLLFGSKTIIQNSFIDITPRMKQQRTGNKKKTKTKLQNGIVYSALLEGRRRNREQHTINMDISVN